MTLEEAMSKIKKLEEENAYLLKELDYYKKRKTSGRQKHNAKWQSLYNDFVVLYESGMSLIEISKKENVSLRTIYRYKTYYDLYNKGQDG